jgi:hypothetical protein
MLLAHHKVKESNSIYHLLEKMFEVIQASLEGA